MDGSGGRKRGQHDVEHRRRFAAQGLWRRQQAEAYRCQRRSLADDSCATSRDQASIVAKQMFELVRASPLLSRRAFCTSRVTANDTVKRVCWDAGDGLAALDYL